MTRLHYPPISGSKTLDQPTTEAAPRRLKHWDLIGLVAEGNLAQVYRARPSDARPDLPAGYAIKVLRPAWQNDLRAVGLLRQEAMVARSVQHPHVISVLSAALAQPPHYLVMPWLRGATLRQRLRLGRPLPLSSVLWIGRQVATGLDALYRGGWMHGDIKPSNLLLGPEGHLTLLDLGFARRVMAPEGVGERWVMGTCSYLAPELLSSWVRPGIHSDIYSLGVVLYEMLAGRLPFAAHERTLLAAAHKRDAPPALERVLPQLPSDVARLVHRMLAKDPLRRPGTPDELIREITPLELAAAEERIGDLSPGSYITAK